MVTFKKDKNPTVKPGDWIQVLTFHGGMSVLEEHIRTNGLAKVTDVQRDQLIVDLIGTTGQTLHNSYYVDRKTGKWNKLEGPPEFRTLLAGIPNTAEVQAFKDQTYELVMRYASRHGYQSVVMEALKELGIEKPGSADVVATVTFTVRAKVDALIAGTTEKNFKRHFEQLGASEQAARLAQAAHNENVTVEYELKPYKPMIVPSPTGAEKKEGGK